MGEVVKFPSKDPLIPRRYRISLFTEFQVECVIAALNIFPKCLEKINEENLSTLDPIFIRQSLDFAIESGILSEAVKNELRSLIKYNIEEITFEDI